jgi:lysophospholipase L1-like esterase
MISKFGKVFTLAFFSLFFVFLSYAFLHFIAEKYFFDRLSYQKSPIYGYSDRNRITNQISRYKDLNSLITQDNQRSSKVLGVTNDYTIAVIGDSFAYGLGVKESESFPNVLEKELKKVKPVKIYTLAQPGDSLVDQYSKFVLAEDKVHPDLYIVTLLENDLTFNFIDEKIEERYPGETVLFEQLEKECPSLPVFGVSGWSSKLTFSEVVDQVYWPAFFPENNNICIANQIMKKIQASNQKVLFFAFEGNDLNGIPHKIKDVEIKQRYMTQVLVSLAKNNQLDVLYPTNFIFKAISEKEGHPNAKTHFAYATALFQEINKNKKWKFNP